MNAARIALITAAALLASCGTGDADLAAPVSFRAHALKCDVGGLQAKLQILDDTGMDECPLDVAADHRVEGLCLGINTGQFVQFRLVYFVLLEGDDLPLELATALREVDLRIAKEPEIVLAFDVEELNVEYDDDNDKTSNIVEFCRGGHPRDPRG